MAFAARPNLEHEERFSPGYWEIMERNNQKILHHYDYLIGQICTHQLVEDLTAATSRPIRAFGEYFTEEIRGDRLNLNLSQENVILSLSFG